VKYEAWNQSGKVWIPQATPSQTGTHSKIVGHKTRKGGSPNLSKLNLPSSAASSKNVISLSDDKTGQKAHNHRKKCSYPRSSQVPKFGTQTTNLSCAKPSPLYISVSCWKLCVNRAKINTSNRSLGTNRRLDSACCAVNITSLGGRVQGPCPKPALSTVRGRL